MDSFRLPRINITIGLLCFLHITSCKRAQPVNSIVKQENQISDGFSASEAAFRQISESGYLPTDYSANNCYARALYTSIELAIKGIASQAHFVFSKRGQTLSNSSGEKWNFHVASSVRVGNRIKVYDTLIPDRGMISVADWLQTMNVGPEQVHHISIPGFHYVGFYNYTLNGKSTTNPYASVVCGNANNCESFLENPSRSLFIPGEDQSPLTVDEMGKVELFMLMHACGSLVKSIRNLNYSAEEESAKLQLLTERTGTLVRQLIDQNRLRAVFHFGVVSGQDLDNGLFGGSANGVYFPPGIDFQCGIGDDAVPIRL